MRRYLYLVDPARGRSWRSPAIWLGALVLASLATPAATQQLLERTTADGARYTVPAQWPVGQTIRAQGTGWTDIAGTAGSTIAVVYDFGSVRSPDTVDDEIWLRVVADAKGNWSADLPFPPEAGWAVGQVHKVHFLTGSLGQNDKARGALVEVTLVEARPKG